MNKFDFRKLIEWLSYILRCPVCGHKYNLDQTRIVDGGKDELKPSLNTNLLIHTDCESCKSSVVFSIAVDGPEIFSIGMVTDLTSSDSSRFKNTRPITSDDILATHQFLTNFDGDFKKLLNIKSS